MTWLADLGALTGDRALDVATGRGSLARELAGRYREVVGIDFEGAIARAEPHPGVTFQAMDATAMAFPDASFDLVAISWSLHHLEDATAVMSEMARVLKPGGHFLIIEPYVARTGTNQDHHVEAHLLVAEVDRDQGLAHFPLFQRMQIGSVIQGLGLADIDFKPLEQLPEEKGWSLEESQAQARPWIEKMGAIAADEAQPAERRERASALVEKMKGEGLRTSPVMRTYGRKPG